LWEFLLVIPSVFALGGLLMLYGGVQDVLLFFAPDMVPVPSWYSVTPVVGLVYGLIVFFSGRLEFIFGIATTPC